MCEITQTINNSLTDEQIKKIFEKVEELKPTDYFYFLRLSYFRNSCTNPVYEEDFGELYGEVRTVKISEFEDNCRKEIEYVLIPQTPEVIIGVFQKQEDKKLVRVYTFNFHRGWRYLDI